MSSKIKVYKDEALQTGAKTGQAGAGTLVSSGDWSEPIESGDIEVPAEGHEEGNWIKCAVRCDEHFETREKSDKHVTLSIETAGDHADKWQLSPTASEGDPDWGEDLDITSQVDDGNTLFYIRARVAHTESPANDKSCQVQAAALIGAQ